MDLRIHGVPDVLKTRQLCRGRASESNTLLCPFLLNVKGETTMIEVVGQNNTAVCYTGELEEAAAAQIQAVCDQSAFADCKIRIMPDVHAGMGCTIGTTMTITDKIVPGMVGVDIGCGMETVRIAEKEIDFARLDEIIHKYIPCGREVRSQPHKLNDQIDLTKLRCSPYVNLERARRSIGTLGGGNHFIEVDRGENGDLFIVVHSGSRHIGNEVAKYYQDEGRKEMESIYTTCVDRTTLDEAPMAYKGIDKIISHIGPTVEILERITPVYNFKAAE